MPFIAKPFKEVQQTVVDLIEHRVLVGHAISKYVPHVYNVHPYNPPRYRYSCSHIHLR